VLVTYQIDRPEHPACEDIVAPGRVSMHWRHATVDVDDLCLRLRVDHCAGSVPFGWSVDGRRRTRGMTWKRGIRRPRGRVRLA
jgi:hypothetical protein